MATDYDKPRVKAEDMPANEFLETIQTQRSTTTQTTAIDAEDSDTAEGFDLPGAILEEERTVQVVPVQENEFTCMSCFLVHRRRRLAREKNGDRYCAECEE